MVTLNPHCIEDKVYYYLNTPQKWRRGDGIYRISDMEEMSTLNLTTLVVIYLNLTTLVVICLNLTTLVVICLNLTTLVVICLNLTTLVVICVLHFNKGEEKICRSPFSW